MLFTKHYNRCRKGEGKVILLISCNELLAKKWKWELKKSSSWWNREALVISLGWGKEEKTMIKIIPNTPFPHPKEIKTNKWIKGRKTCKDKLRLCLRCS